MGCQLSGVLAFAVGFALLLVGEDGGVTETRRSKAVCRERWKRGVTLASRARRYLLPKLREAPEMRGGQVLALPALLLQMKEQLRLGSWMQSSFFAPPSFFSGFLQFLPVPVYTNLLVDTKRIWKRL